MAFSKDEQLKRDLINKYLEKGRVNPYSIISYHSTEKISGDLFLAIKRMMDEYKSNKP